MSEYRTEIYLIRRDKLRVVREESAMEDIEGGQPNNLEYTPAHSQILPTAPMASGHAPVEGLIVVPPLSTSFPLGRPRLLANWPSSPAT